MTAAPIVHLSASCAFDIIYCPAAVAAVLHVAAAAAPAWCMRAPAALLALLQLATPTACLPPYLAPSPCCCLLVQMYDDKGKLVPRPVAKPAAAAAVV